MHYAYVLTIGLAGVAALGPVGRRIVLGLALLALVTDRTLPREWAMAWREVGLRPRSLGLWASEEADRHWRETVGAVRGAQPRAVFVATFANAGVFDPAFEPPVNLFFVRGMGDMVDVERRADQIRETDTVVVAGPALIAGAEREFLLNGGAAIREALAAFDDVGGNEHFRILRRSRSQDR
jgi:hypothetical protein